MAVTQAGVDPYDANANAPYELVSFTSCFHGRTMGALALTYKEQYKTPFYPMVPGHQLAEYNDLESAAKVGGVAVSFHCCCTVVLLLQVCRMWGCGFWDWDWCAFGAHRDCVFFSHADMSSLYGVLQPLVATDCWCLGG